MRHGQGALDGRGSTEGNANLAARSGQEEELRLIARVAERDLEAFEQLYRIYHRRLSRFLFNLLRRPPVIEEVLNDTMMVVWEGAGSFNGASKLSTWIFTIAYRKAAKALRRQDEPVEDDRSEELVSLDAGPDEELAQERRQALLAEAVATLSPDHRAVVDLTYYHEMGYREIAGIMDCPVDTVKTRMFHARRHLRRKLGGGLADWI
ncbi:RNA polymerase sigma-70 factor (ECF subfamily) [Sphingomonas kyeonggiensis]|nr:RNA polymerase sigma-70 factor (ECF subfamily) [Sphingomonas kyeonggiensis]